MPEKGLNEIPRSVKEQYDKGLAAFNRNNLGYAVALLTQVLDQEPECFAARKTLRATQFKIAGSEISWLRRFLGALNPRLLRIFFLLRSRPYDALTAAEHILNKNPHNLVAHHLLAKAALQADLPNTAVLSLEIIFKYKPRNKRIVLSLGDALALAGDPERGEKIVSELGKVYPNDMKLATAAKNLSAQKTMTHGGYDSASTYRDILKDEEEAISLEQEQRQTRSEEMIDRLIRENATRLEQEPGNSTLMEKLSELYEEKKDYENAVYYLQQMVAAQGQTDPALQKRIAETKLKQFDQQVSTLDPNQPDQAEQIEKLRRERERYQISECEERVKQYPNDLQMRFELGQLYFQNGRYKEAIQELQKAQNNPNRKIQAMNLLGQAFARRGMTDLAVRTLENALKEKEVFDSEKKSLLYELGCVLEDMGKKEEAMEYLKQVYEVDMGFKDVAAKVDAHYGNE